MEHCIAGESKAVNATSGVIKQYRYASEKPSLLARMKKIEGQAKGIQQMIAEDRYCIDIVQQLTALSRAVDEVSLLMLESHIEGCVADAIRDQHGEVHIKELVRTIRKAMKW
jgi:DNA-binding FrmR family transcriptional regulator